MSYQLVRIHDRLVLHDSDKNAPGDVTVDFVHGALGYRRQFGGGKNQLIAKAIGIRPQEKLFVLDVTAGLGRDAFVLSALGCDVLMCERSPIIYALLEDGLKRAEKESWFQTLYLKLIQTDAIAYLNTIMQALSHTHTHTHTHTLIPDVIYIDPMFPEKTKSALVKKEMRALREVVGEDSDAEKLLSLALSIAKKRVVVKRARLAPRLTDLKPNIVFIGKSSRFDVYKPCVQPW